MLKHKFGTYAKHKQMRESKEYIAEVGDWLEYDFGWLDLDFEIPKEKMGEVCEYLAECIEIEFDRSTELYSPYADWEVEVEIDIENYHIAYDAKISCKSEKEAGMMETAARYEYPTEKMEELVCDWMEDFDWDD